jgi:hypothetical protein
LISTRPAAGRDRPAESAHRRQGHARPQPADRRRVPRNAGHRPPRGHQRTPRQLHLSRTGSEGMNDELDVVIRVARPVAEGEALTTDLIGKEGVPTAMRLVVAAVALTAADQPVNKKALSTAALAARSASYRDHAKFFENAKRRCGHCGLSRTTRRLAANRVSHISACWALTGDAHTGCSALLTGVTVLSAW